MTIYLASIRKPQNHHGVVFSIATGDKGEMQGVSRLEFLKPGWTIVKAHQRKEITDNQYIYGYRDVKTRQVIPGYRQILQARWPAVSAWLKSLNAQTDLTLVCYCREYENGQRKFCHRQYIKAVIEHYRPDLEIILH